MNSEILVFEHPEFGKVRTLVGDNGEPMFVGKDVAERLGYSNASKAVIKHVDDEDKDSIMIEAHSQNGNLVKTKVTIINESGMYSLILSSKLPNAKQFKRWVTSEVLPQIRKTGGYIPVKPGDTVESLLKRAEEIASKTFESLTARLQETEQKMLLLQQRLDEQQPAVDFANAIMETDDSISMSDMANIITQQGYKIGRNNLYKELREQGIIRKTSTSPFHKYVEDGWFVVCVKVWAAGKYKFEKIAPRVTAWGQRKISEIFRELKRKPVDLGHDLFGNSY